MRSGDVEVAESARETRECKHGPSAVSPEKVNSVAPPQSRDTFSLDDTSQYLHRAPRPLIDLQLHLRMPRTRATTNATTTRGEGRQRL